MQPDYMLMLSAVLTDESTPIHVRNAAGLALKNTLSARVRHYVTMFTLQPLIVWQNHRTHNDRATTLSAG